MHHIYQSAVYCHQNIGLGVLVIPCTTSGQETVRALFLQPRTHEAGEAL